MRRLLFLACLIVAALVVSAPASADPKTGCPADESGWALWTVDGAAAEIFPDLLPGLYPWEDADGLAGFLDERYDKNADDTVCVKALWGDALNPNSHWYKVGVDALGSPTVQYFIRDNNANSDKG